MLMFFLEILCDLLDMLTHIDTTSCMPSRCSYRTEPTGTNIKPSTVSDILIVLKHMKKSNRVSVKKSPLC